MADLSSTDPFAQYVFSTSLELCESAHAAAMFSTKPRVDVMKALKKMGARYLSQISKPIFPNERTSTLCSKNERATRDRRQGWGTVSSLLKCLRQVGSGLFTGAQNPLGRVKHRELSVSSSKQNIRKEIRLL